MANSPLAVGSLLKSKRTDAAGACAAQAKARPVSRGDMVLRIMDESCLWLLLVRRTGGTFHPAEARPQQVAVPAEQPGGIPGRVPHDESTNSSSTTVASLLALTLAAVESQQEKVQFSRPFRGLPSSAR